MPVQIRDDLNEIATLAWSITGAHSSAIFLPTELLAPPMQGRMREGFTRKDGAETSTASIDMISVRSHSRLVQNCRIQVGSGLLGWVADQGRSIHLAPFEVGSSSIGIYLDSEPIKSLVAVPISFSGRDGGEHSSTCGVVMCDSLRPEGFTSAQIKSLEQIASITRCLISWAQSTAQLSHVETSWDIFSQKTFELGGAIGASSIEVLRLRMDSFEDLRRQSGISSAVQLTEQFFRLAQQTLPPHFPLVKLPNGDVLIAVDNMMSNFFQQKLHSLANHLHKPSKPITIRIEGYAAVLDTRGSCDLDATLKQEPLTKKIASTVGGTRA